MWGPASGDRRASLARTLRDRYLAHPDHGPLPALLLVLGLVTGLVDAVSILRMGHVFVANMTGNIAFIALGLAGAIGISVPASATALAGFVIGTLATGRLPAAWRADRAQLMWTTALVKLSLVLPVLAVAIAIGISSSRSSTYLLSALLAASMGVQNATVGRMGVPDLSTNVLTTTLTGLLVRLPERGWRDSLTGNATASIAFLFAGAAIGAAIVLDVNAATALGVGMVLLAGVGAVAHRARRRNETWVPFPTG